MEQDTLKIPLCVSYPAYGELFPLLEVDTTGKRLTVCFHLSGQWVYDWLKLVMGISELSVESVVKTLGVNEIFIRESTGEE